MIKRFAVALFMVVSMAFSAVPVGASAPLSQVAVCSGGFADFFGFQPWYACLPKTCPGAGPGDGTPKVCSLTDVLLIIFPVVDWVIKAAVFISAGMIFLMLFKIATSRGNASQYSTAVSGIRDAVVGLVIAVLSVAILNFVAGAFN